MLNEVTKMVNGKCIDCIFCVKANTHGGICTKKESIYSKVVLDIGKPPCNTFRWRWVLFEEDKDEDV